MEINKFEKEKDNEIKNKQEKVEENGNKINIINNDNKNETYENNIKIEEIEIKEVNDVN